MAPRLDQQPVPTVQIDAVAAAARVFVGVVLASTTEVESVVTLRQLRALVILHRYGDLNLGALAEHLAIHPSNATRLCDQLVDAGLVRRRQADHDRRHIRLQLDTRGADLVARVLQRRRTALEQIMQKMAPEDREHLAGTLGAFAAAAGEVPEDALWMT